MYSANCTLLFLLLLFLLAEFAVHLRIKYLAKVLQNLLGSASSVGNFRIFGLLFAAFFCTVPGRRGS